jgi:hypothetical protein
MSKTGRFGQNRKEEKNEAKLEKPLNLLELGKSRKIGQHL